MATHNEVPPATTTAGSHPIESAHSSDGKTEFQGGTSLHNGVSGPHPALAAVSHLLSLDAFQH